MKRKIFFSHIAYSEKFKKRKKLNIKVPNIFYILKLKSNLRYYSIGGIICIFTGIAFLFFGPFFRIQSIDILKKENITNINIAYKAIEDIKGSPLITANGKEIAQSLQNYQKNIKEVSIKKVFPHTLRIVIESYKEAYNIQINGKSYIITENGVLIPAKFSPDIPEVKITGKNFQISGIIDYKNVFKEEYIRKIQDVSKQIGDNFPAVKIEDLYYFPQEKEVHIHFFGAPIIIFDLDIEISEQIKKLAIFYKEAQNSDFSDIYYIDLRINNKIFFCPLTEEYQCKINLKKIYGYQ